MIKDRRVVMVIFGTIVPVPSIIEAWFAAFEKTICPAICLVAFREQRNRWTPDLASDDQT